MKNFIQTFRPILYVGIIAMTFSCSDEDEWDIEQRLIGCWQFDSRIISAYTQTEGQTNILALHGDGTCTCYEDVVSSSCQMKWNGTWRYNLTKRFLYVQPPRTPNENVVHITSMTDSCIHIDKYGYRHLDEGMVLTTASYEMRRIPALQPSDIL